MKKASYVFVFLLVLALVFILGFRSGQRVEKTNKVIDYVLSITPTKIPPTPTPILYKEYKSKRWGLTFTYPEGLEIKESTNTPVIFFDIIKK